MRSEAAVLSETGTEWTVQEVDLGALADGTLRFSSGGTGITTMCLLGTFARHTVVHHSQVLKGSR